MKNSESILKRQKYHSRFKNGDMDFTFNWAIGISQLIGLSASQLFFAVKDIKDGDPVGWRDGFAQLAKSQLDTISSAENKLFTGQKYMEIAYALRAELQYYNPLEPDFIEKVERFEEIFQKGIELLDVPMRAINIPFEDIYLPAYYLEHPQKNCPTLIMIGGGDTFREDLFYFAGYPGWKRDYNVLMIDLPGQGKVPSLGQCFRVDMDKPIKTAIDWLEVHAENKLDKLAIYGVSGGGYFTAQTVARDKRINAWIASTPITDVGLVFKKEFGAALKAPGWLIRAYTKFIGALNEGAEINLKKYAWQFGTDDFRYAVDEVLKQAIPVEAKMIDCPSLFLLGENEGQELIRQTEVLYQDLSKRGVSVTLRRFTAEEGADAHCQVNNLRLAHSVIFDWLDNIFDYQMPDDVRILI